MIDPYEMNTYPGSPSGPDPTDDPGHFAEWFDKNKPRALKLLHERILDLSREEEERNQRQTALEESYFNQTTEKYSLKTAAEERLLKYQYVLTDYDSNFFQSGGSVEIGDGSEKDYISDLPMVPDNSPKEYQLKMQFLDKWFNFRLFNW